MMALLTRPRTWIITAVVVVVVAGAAVWWFGFAHKTDADAAPATSTTLTVSTQTLQQSVSGTGTLSPTVDQQVSFAASGTVTAVSVQAGQTVKAGDTLGTVTTTQADADLASAQATLASDQAKLASDQASSTGSAADTAQISADQAAVSVAQASVTSAQNEVNGTTLTAPVAGLVTAVNVAVGDSVTGSSASSSGSGSSASGSGSSGSGSSRSGSSSTGTGSTSGSSSSSSSSSGAFEITGTDSWTTEISVAAAQVKNLKTGDQVTLSTTENPSFFGTVSSIGLLPSTSSGAATYPVDVQVTGTPQSLYDGVSVTANVIYKKVTDAIAVPSLAVTQSNGKSTVTKVVDGKNVQQTVTTGIQQGQYVQITDGLKAGDKIVLKIARRTTGGTGTTGTGGTRGGTGGTGFGGGTGFPGGFGGTGGSGFGGTGGTGFGGRGFGGTGGGTGTGTTGSFQRGGGSGSDTGAGNR
ncbi:efflux RND transporter periplasmic adaptor subunit [Gryllotalpicola protaetiae]|nr:biotin/lipoyl-binding protein [Gryllotalpicola protaetiae]